LIDSIFKDQIGSSMEAYVDDLVIKSRTEEDMIARTPMPKRALGGSKSFCLEASRATAPIL
jgi:hypothetical protein